MDISRTRSVRLMSMLTWNCRHIANAVMRPKIEIICLQANCEPLVICTPDELMPDENQCKSNAMWQDSIVQETLRLRKEYAAQFKGNSDAMFQIP